MDTPGNQPSQTPQTEKLPPQEVLNLTPPRPGVKRLRPKAVAAIIAALCFILAAALVIGLRRPVSRNSGQVATNDPVAQPSAGVVERQLAALPQDYTFDIQEVLGEPEEAEVQEEKEVDQAEMSGPVVDAPVGPTPQELAAAEAQQRQLEQLRQELVGALDSPLVFTQVQTRSRRTDDSTDDRSPADRQPDLNPPDTTILAHDPLPQDDVNRQDSKLRFLTRGSAVEPYVKQPLLVPRSPYELKAGSIIAAALVTAINSDLPGQVIGQITEHVYDSVSGRYLLVPQGSRLLGRYQSLISNGQNRALIVWDRLILPNGDSIALESMPGVDGQGQAGLADRVDYHLDRVGLAAALSIAITFAGNLARGRSGEQDDSRDVVGDTVAQEASRLGGRVIDRQLDTQPTITIRRGFPFRVLVNKDVVLRPYEQ